MKINKTLYTLLSCALFSCAAADKQPVIIQQDTPMVRDDWPRQISEEAVSFSISQPQVETWQGNILTARAAVGAKPQAGKKYYGVVWFTARTEVNKNTRMVLLQDFAITKINFKGIPDNGRGYITALKSALPKQPVQVALDRLEAGLEVADAAAGKNKAVQVKNTPPRIIFATRLSVLVLVDGKPVLREIKGSGFKHIINTGVLLVADASGSPYYLWLADRWVQAPSLDGPWSAAAGPSAALDAAKKDLAADKKIDLLENVSPEIKKNMQQGQLPAIYISTVAARLIQTKGTPDLQDVPGTALRYAANSNDVILFDMNSLRYYILINGRWYRSESRNGPWAYVDGKDLPPDFARIPAGSPAGAALFAVPGTSQARQAVVAATTPHTQTVAKSATATVAYDGQPQFNPIEGTPLRYAVNAAPPVIRIDEKTYYVVDKGIWFSGTSPVGPWAAATSVPQILYTIPPSSPVHYVTYVYVYGSTPMAVYTGYTSGYNGAMVTSADTVVYSTGYVYPGWTGAYWYPPPNYYYYNDDYFQVHETYDGKYVQRGYSDYGTYTKVGDTTFARTEDGHYATRDGEVYKREAGGWKQYDADSGEWELTNYSKAKDIKKIQDHRQGDAAQPAAGQRAGRFGNSGPDQTADSGEGPLENRSERDTARELNDSYSARSEGERRVSTYGRSGGFGSGGFHGGGRGGRR